MQSMKITKNICIMKIFSSTGNAMREVAVRDLLSRRPFCPAGELPPFTGWHSSVPETSPSTVWALAETWLWPRSSRALRTCCSWGDAAPQVFQSRYAMGTPQQKGLQGGHGQGSPPPAICTASSEDGELQHKGWLRRGTEAGHMLS